MACGSGRSGAPRRKDDPYAAGYTVLSATLMSGVIVLLVIKHVAWLAGLVGSFYVHVRKAISALTDWDIPLAFYTLVRHLDLRNLSVALYVAAQVKNGPRAS
jgi:hypothetical protein